MYGWSWHGLIDFSLTSIFYYKKICTVKKSPPSCACYLSTSRYDCGRYYSYCCWWSSIEWSIVFNSDAVERSAAPTLIFFVQIRVKFEIIRHLLKRNFNVSLGNIFNTILCVRRGQVPFPFSGKSFLDIFAPGKSLVPQWVCSMALCEVHLTRNKNIHGCVSLAIFRRRGTTRWTNGPQWQENQFFSTCRVSLRRHFHEKLFQNWFEELFWIRIVPGSAFP